MKIFTDHPDHGERKTDGLRLDRLSVVAGLVVLLCLIPGLVALSQDVTTTETTFGLTIDGTFTPLSSLPSDPVVGQEVTVVWQVTAPTSPEVTDWDTVSLSRQLMSPGSLTWDLLNDTVLPGEGEDDENWIKWTHKFTPERAGTYTAQGSYPDCGDCAPPLEGSSSGSVTASVDKANTTTSLSLDPAASVTGQDVTITATVATDIPDPVGSPPTPLGTVTFYVDDLPIGLAALDGGTPNTATLSASFSAEDVSVTITATYAGDSNYNESTAAEVTLAVGEASTAVAITSCAPEPSVVDQFYMVSGTVTVDSPGGGTPTGTVTVGDGTDTSEPGTVEADGSWSCSLASTSAGAKTITATYSGDANYSGDATLVGDPAGEQPVAHAVDEADTTTTVSSSADPSVTGQSVTFTATVVAASPGSGTPTGTVTFYKGSIDVGNEIGSDLVLDGSGEAAVSTTFDASEDPVAVYARYSGDSDYQTSDSVQFTQDINEATTAVAFTSDTPDPSAVGQAYTVSGTVTPVYAAGTHTTSGTVTVSDGTPANDVTGIALTWSVDHWNWSCSLTSTTAGTKTLTATYSEDTNYAANSRTEAHTVSRASTAVEIASDTPDPSAFGEWYAVSGKVTPDYTTGLDTTTTGTVDVSDGTNTCTDLPLTWNTDHWDWSCSLPSTTAGTKTLTATYSGDANYASDNTLVTDASAERPVDHTVSQASTTVAITSDNPAPSVFGESYTVIGTIAPANTAGPHTTTGTVDVSDGSDTWTDTTLGWDTDHWDWSCSVPSTSVGTKTITATYSGDDNYVSDSEIALHIVSKASTTAAITSDTPNTSVAGQTYIVSGTVTVTSPGSLPLTGGSVTVSDGTESATATLTLSDGTWSCSFVSTTAGAKTLTAAYSGDDNFSAPIADPTTTHTVNKTGTSVAITSDDPDPSVVGQSYTVSGMVKPANTAGTHTTTGTVDVSDGTNTCTDSSLAWSGDHWDWSCSLTSTTVGTPKTITATYSGDDNYSTSSGTATHTVRKTNTTAAITSDTPDPSAFGDWYTVSGTVKPVDTAGPDTTTGTVDVSDETNMCTATLAWDTDHWDWSCSLPSTAVGTKTITAEYSGDASYNESVGTASHVVTKGTVSVGVTPTTWSSGSSGAFTATLTVLTGAGTPSGTVTFQIKDKDGAIIATTGLQPVSGDPASATSTSVTLTADQSPVQVTATYSGDASFAGSSGSASVTVNPTGFTITGDDPDPSAAGQTYTVTWGFAGAPLGAYVILSDGYVISGHIPSGDLAGTLTSTNTSVTTVTADLYNSSDTLIDTETTPHSVVARKTATAIAGPPGSVCISQPVLLIATVTETPDSSSGPEFTGTVTWDSSGAATFYPATCDISQGGQCSTYYTPAAIDVGSVNVTASYSGDASYGSSVSPFYLLTVVQRSTHTTVFGSDTPLVVGDTATFLVTVTDTSSCVPTTPTGDVSVSVDPSGAGTLTALTGGSHTLVASDGGQFTFTYTPTSATTTPHTFTADYHGDSAHIGSIGTFAQAIEKRQADIVMTASPSTAYIYQPVTVTVQVADDTTAGSPSTPAGTVTFSDGGRNGVFSPESLSLDSGACAVTYTPHENDAGITTLTATYDGSAYGVHEGASTSQDLVVLLRPTKTTVTGSTPVLLVRQSYTFTVTVEDIAPAGTASSPTGSLVYSSQLPAGDVSLVPGTGYAQTAMTFVYTCLGLTNAGAYDIVKADYTPDDGIHARSDIPTDLGAENNVAWGQAVKKRPTVTTITLPTSTATGVTFTAGAAEDPANALPLYPLAGKLHLLDPSTYKNVGLAVPFVADWPTPPGAPPLANVTVMYEPSDRVHLPSTASENIDRSSWFTPIIVPPNPEDYDECTDGCGTGGTDIENAIYALNSTEVALEAVKSGLEVVALVLDIIPDPVTAAGCVVVGGATIPVSDIAKAVVAGAGIALDIAILAMDTDLDDDGLPDVIEETITHTDPFKVDSDGDGMGDLDEIDEAGGYYGGTRRPNPNDADSDDDGISDGDEANLTHTDFCVADTDCDTVSDGAEASTGKVFAGLSAPSSDIRDQADPLIQDTDGDGLRDDLEIAFGCPYVNDADSDDDGLDDGHEDTDRDGAFDPGTIGGTGTQGDGETNFCDPDTDNDGLLDGEEEGLLGEGLVEAIAWNGSSEVVVHTEPALDTDSDDDGLSDGEEIKVTQTDPLNWDTDDDTLSDANELIAVGGVWPTRNFTQVSDPLDPDTDDDGLGDEIEYSGTGLGTSQGLGGVGDEVCPYVNDDDSDDDGLQDGTESWNGDASITTLTIGRSDSQSSTSPTTGETDFCNPDTDGDGLTDGEEVALLGGLPVNSSTGFTTVTPKGVSTTFGVDGALLDPTVPALDDDSDNDGLSDYEEVTITHTDPLDQDSDNDTLSDANELVATGGSWPNRAFIQESDPLDPDTDDDDLYDYIEYRGSGLGTSRGTGGDRDTECPYVNDDDSDDDGLQDGTEDANHDGTWGVLGNGMLVGTFSREALRASDDYPWETDLCNPDTDGDGLLDGEEVGQLGGTPVSERPKGANETFSTVAFRARSTTLPEGTSEVPAGYTHAAPSPGTGNALIGPYTFEPTDGVSTTETVPALDVDSDDDGLSDYEEVNITGTDPLDQDTDNDTLMDADELVAVGGTSGSTPRRTFDQVSNPLDINTDDDHLFDPQEYAGSGLSQLAGAIGGTRDSVCPVVSDDDSDGDGIQDGAVVDVDPALTVTGSLHTPNTYPYGYRHYEDFIDLNESSLPFPGRAQADVGDFNGEQQNDSVWNVCDPDSDGDGLNDGEETAIGTNSDDCDTDDDGRNDWHEVTGGGPIPTDPFDPDTDDDGLLDSAEVFGSNPTNPVNADTDGDGLCDGGAGTPWMTSGDPRVIVNPLCKSCSTPGLDPCDAGGVRTGSAGGIGDHPNPSGYGEDKDGDGQWDGSIGQAWVDGTDGTPETDPNQFDTDGDGDGDGVEVLGFSTSRQDWIPATDLLDRPITVEYPPCGCLEPLIDDTDGDHLSDGYEDLNHDGNFDFLPSDFDIDTSSVETSLPDPEETNPCDPDSDHDGLTDYLERYQPNPASVFPFNPTNPLDHDTDNDWLTDGYEVFYKCVKTEYTTLDNDSDGLIDEDWVDGLDNDGDGLIDEDPVDFTIRFVSVLDPTNRDSDSDGYIDGLDEDPCNSEMIPVLFPALGGSVDWDGDGFSDDDEIAAGTHPNDPEDHPTAYGTVDVDFDECIDDRIWLEPGACCGEAGWVVVDLDNNVLIDLRIAITSKSVKHGDFDKDGYEDDVRYTVEYVLSDYRAVQLRGIATIDDYDSDLVIDRVVVERK